MKEETSITFLASERGEFHGMGESISWMSCVPYYANHTLVQEAVRELEKLEEQQKRKKTGHGTVRRYREGRV